MLSPAGFAEFPSQKLATDFLSRIGQSSSFRASGGDNVRVKAATSQVNQHRNWALRRASDLVKSRVPTANVRIDFKARNVSVDSAIAFEQGRGDLTGTFLGRFSDLTVE